MAVLGPIGDYEWYPGPQDPELKALSAWSRFFWEGPSAECTHEGMWSDPHLEDQGGLPIRGSIQAERLGDEMITERLGDEAPFCWASSKGMQGTGGEKCPSWEPADRAQSGQGGAGISWLQESGLSAVLQDPKRGSGGKGSGSLS